MILFGMLGLSLIAIFVAMNASNKAEMATRRLNALETWLAAETAGGGREVSSVEPTPPESGDETNA